MQCRAALSLRAETHYGRRLLSAAAGPLCSPYSSVSRHSNATAALMSRQGMWASGRGVKEGAVGRLFSTKGDKQAGGDDEGLKACGWHAVDSFHSR